MEETDTPQPEVIWEGALGKSPNPVQLVGLKSKSGLGLMWIDPSSYEIDTIAVLTQEQVAAIKDWLNKAF